METIKSTGNSNSGAMGLPFDVLFWRKEGNLGGGPSQGSVTPCDSMSQDRSLLHPSTPTSFPLLLRGCL